MTSAFLTRVAAISACFWIAQATCRAQKLVDSDFWKGGFAALGWKANGAWDVFTYPKQAANNPWAVARFGANKPNGSLTRTFDEIRNPRNLTLSLEYGWGWGDVGQAADSVSLMLLNSKGNGYVFKFHRCKASWAVPWGRVANGDPPKDLTWAHVEIDGTRASVRDGGGLGRVVISRESDGAWSITGKDWNKGRGATVRFSDAGTTSFSRLVLLGTENFDEQVFDRIVLTTNPREPSTSCKSAPPRCATMTDSANGSSTARAPTSTAHPPRRGVPRPPQHKIKSPYAPQVPQVPWRIS